MRLPSISRIVVDQLPKDVQKWIGLVVDPLNSFMLTIKNGLNKGITINDNLSGAVKTVTVSGNSVEFTYESSRAPKAVIVGNVVCTSSWTPVAWSHTWNYSTGIINCTFYGLDSTKKYQVTFVIFDD